METTFYSDPKIDPFDRIAIEVGDSKQVNFYPQVKIMRWDNEVNCSIRLVHDELATDLILSEKDGLVKWDGKTITSQFYDLADGYEFEVIHKEKQLNNRVAFTLQSKGLDFFYQPPLTEEHKVGETYKDKSIGSVTETEVRDIDGNLLINRPENIVGSYALFMATPGINFEGGNIYGGGKVGHIYRPKITDAIGMKCWGVLSLDFDFTINSRTLNIDIPQDFVDKATYPISIDPNLGYSTIGASNDINSANYFFALYFTQSDASGGTLSSIKMAAWEASGGNHARMAVYTNTSGTPPAAGSKPNTLITGSDSGSLVCRQGTKPTTDAQLTGATITGTISAATYYWVCSNFDNDAVQSTYDTAADYSFWYGSSLYSSFPPATSPAVTTVQRKYTGYATYAAAGGGLSIPVAMLNQRYRRI